MRIYHLAGLAAALALPYTMSARAQTAPESSYTLNHGEITAYGDYFRVVPSSGKAINFVGVGGRVGFNVNPHAAIEGEINYDFARNYTTITNNGGTTSGSTTTVTSNLRPLSGLFGPKFQFGSSGPFRAFLTGKVGFLEFSTGGGSPSGNSFSNNLGQFGGTSTHFAAYPGGGIEAFFGPLGLRAEAGDEIFWDNGTYNNLRVAVGPTFRF